MQMLGKGLRQTVGECFEQDCVVVVMPALVFGDAFIDADACCYCERSEKVRNSGFPGRNKVGQTLVWPVKRLDHLLAKKMKRRRDVLPRIIGIDFDVVANAVCREQSDYARCAKP